MTKGVFFWDTLYISNKGYYTKDHQRINKVLTFSIHDTYTFEINAKHIALHRCTAGKICMNCISNSNKIFNPKSEGKEDFKIYNLSTLS